MSQAASKAWRFWASRVRAEFTFMANRPKKIFLAVCACGLWPLHSSPACLESDYVETKPVLLTKSIMLSIFQDSSHDPAGTRGLLP